ncbi:DUF6302 family protein [Streptomyces sp. NPDC020800]|uniref:DUF6302 family protein n=1 Tax=Streptomyces sp. NPDC020800 TaxID=3365092 RepID=UPI0037B6EFE0
MKTPPAPERGAQLVTLLPPEDAYDYEFFAARLHDQHLLHSSVAVRVFRAPLLAVPVGGLRRGGTIGAGPCALALAIREALLGRDGFPNLRVGLTGPRDQPPYWVVEWGERPPSRATDDERAHFYGVCDCPARPAAQLTAAVSRCGSQLLARPTQYEPSTGRRRRSLR